MKVKIYYLVGCPYSQKALKLLKQYKIDYDIIKIKSNKDKDMYKEELQVSSFPQIYIYDDNKMKKKKGKIIDRGTHIGGCSEFENYLNILTLMEHNDLTIYKLTKVSKLI